MDISELTDEFIKNNSVDTLFHRLESSKEGLSVQEASERLNIFGKNAIETPKEGAWLKLFRYFWGPIPWMIEVAAILSLVVHHFEDFFIIVVLLVFNACIGFWEEHKADNALAALKKGLALKARVRRGGKWQEIATWQLVPGDVIRIRLGDILPADVVFIEGDYLSVDQSALTGESLPVTKKEGEIGYSSSIAKQGEMVALVTHTGSHTFFGKTAALVAKASSVSHFQKAVMKIGDFLIFVAVGLSLLLTLIELHRGQAPLELLQFVLILVIASIPVAMPAVLSVTMALGALALSKRQVIVSKLQAIEELAGIDILCSDKTGTLTKNELTLGKPLVFGAKNEEEVIQHACLASKEEDQDPIDLAILKNHPMEVRHAKFIPFDPIRKRTEAIAFVGKKEIYVTKGAPQVILELCQPKEQEAIRLKINELASKGYRTLGVAKSSDGKNWSFLGLLPLFDPPRDDSLETIDQAHLHGLDVKMVTGDNVAIAKEIASTLHLGTNIHPASSFFTEATLSTSEEERIEKADGFAEVFPEHKYKIVKALQELGHYVIMTGDGVNDAPALKQADTGIAVSSATEAARAAAAVVLLAPGLKVIIQAIEEARRIFQRMLSYTIYRIAMTFDIMFFVVLAMLFFPLLNGHSFFPLTPVMIILLALLDDIPIMTIAYDNTVLDKNPVRWHMGPIFCMASVLGLLSVLQTFGLFLYGIQGVELGRLAPTELQTMMFLQLVVSGHLLLFLTRTRTFFLSPPFPSSPLLLAILGTQLLAMGVATFGWFVPPISWELIGKVWAYNLVWMFVLDGVKWMTYRVLDKHQKERG